MVCLAQGNCATARLLVVSVLRIIHGVVQATALLALYGHAGDEVSSIDHVAELAEVTRDLHTFEQALRLLIEQVEAIPCTLEDAVVYTCPSCGAEVVTTESTAATTCFYCQNPVVLGGRLSGKFKPNRIIPFALSKEKAIEKFLEMCKKKWFLAKGFASKNQFEKLTGVYFPYWYIDSQRQANMTATGENGA